MVFVRKTHQFLLHLEASTGNFVIARKFRKKQTHAEILLWNHLKGRKCGGYKFRRQHPIHFYVADFYCHEQKLVIEVDGGIHLLKKQKEHDQNRTAELERFGIRVLRFTNDQIKYNISQVLNTITEYISTHPCNS